MSNTAMAFSPILPRTSDVSMIKEPNLAHCHVESLCTNSKLLAKSRRMFMKSFNKLDAALVVSTCMLLPWFHLQAFFFYWKSAMVFVSAVL